MNTRDLVVGMIFLLQTVFGTLGNFFLLFYYFFLPIAGCRLRPIDFIVKNLIVANFLVLFSSGIHSTMESFGVFQNLSDQGCKFLPYIRGVGRVMSIGTTCLLSVFQAVTIIPRSSRWAVIKDKAPKCIVPSVVLCWMVSVLVNVIYPVFMSSSLGINKTSSAKKFGYCFSVCHDQIMDSMYAVLLSFSDAIFFVVMLWASGSMILILYRHKQRVQHLHRSSISSKSSPESRATQTILFLVSTFIYFNIISSIFHIALAVFNNPNWFLLNINAVITLCFPTICPFLLLSRVSSVSRLCSMWALAYGGINRTTLSFPCTKSTKNLPVGSQAQPLAKTRIPTSLHLHPRPSSDNVRQHPSRHMRRGFLQDSLEGQAVPPLFPALSLAGSACPSRPSLVAPRAGAVSVARRRALPLPLLRRVTNSGARWAGLGARLTKETRLGP
ncbi:vomeronasal type-1 receptor 4-like [Suncus etruscus]|uniref:vomeronasal type-1 receptor 4-like n=1 Tax=Suncus etruscus TaxID=109475 RepID=UPI00210F9802|nr:vomeronasal type-1 receptor 4-like [Suncus etruscus]